MLASPPSCAMASALALLSVARLVKAAAALVRRASPCAAYVGPRNLISRSSASPATSLILSLQSLHHPLL